MAEAIAAYGDLVRDGTAPPDFLESYAATLEEAAARKTTRRTARGFGASCGRPSRWRVGRREAGASAMLRVSLWQLLAAGRYQLTILVPFN